MKEIARALNIILNVIISQFQIGSIWLVVWGRPENMLM